MYFSQTYDTVKKEWMTVWTERDGDTMPAAKSATPADSIEM